MWISILTDAKLDEVRSVVLQSPSKRLRRLSTHSQITYGSSQKAIQIEKSVYCTVDGFGLSSIPIELYRLAVFSSLIWFGFYSVVMSTAKNLVNRNPHVFHETLLHCQKIGVTVPDAHTRLCALFGLTEAEIYNLSLSMQVTSVLNTIHQILRQTANPAATGRINDKVVNYQIHVGDAARTVEKEVAHKAVREIFLVYGLNYNQPPFPPPWIGAAGPFLTFMSCFKHRMDEVRTGVGKFPIGKNTQGNQLCADLQQFGLNPTHHIHCEGITYPPVKRSAMAQSVGPLTQLIMLNQSRKNPNFSELIRKLSVETDTMQLLRELFCERIISKGIPYPKMS
ncbi:hypothetical protein J6590_053364 [Homalodisca vitripennis]|nr:hypothetical protein J6590_099249 [Homalodisca vitripennis]KAG8325990.1 hypothetical protein J6590_053364 [Homalodisca vitripennis]